jgi:hypothetical protein
VFESLADIWRARAQELAEQGAGDFREGTHVSSRDYLTPLQLAREILNDWTPHDERTNCTCEYCMPAIEAKLVDLLGPNWYSDYRAGRFRSQRRSRSLAELSSPSRYLVPPPCEFCGTKVLSGALLCPECLGQESAKRQPA